MPTTRRKKSTKESAPAATWVDVSALTPWADNPRKNDGRPVEAVADSIKRFGFAAPIIARKEDGMVIAGHTRLKAAIKLGLERVNARLICPDAIRPDSGAIPDGQTPAESQGCLNACVRFPLRSVDALPVNRRTCPLGTHEVVGTCRRTPGVELPQGLRRVSRGLHGRCVRSCVLGAVLAVGFFG